MFNVMVVEDSKPIARNIKQQVEAAHPRLRVTVISHNGLEALAELRRNPIDLVITDIRMPKMEGLTFIQEARKIKPDLIFLILSGYNDFDYVRQALRLRVTEYLLKPLDVNELSATLDRVVRQLNTASHQRLTRAITDAICLGNTDSRIELPAHWKGFRMAVARLGYFKFGTPALDRDELERLLWSCFPGIECIVADSPGEAEKILIFANTDDNADFDIQVRTFHHRLQEIHRLAYVSCSPAETRPERMTELYKTLSRHLDHNVKPGLPQCWFAEAVTEAGNEAEFPQSDLPEKRTHAKCLTFVRNHRSDALQEEFDQLVTYWENHQLSVYRIRIWLYELFRDLCPDFHHDMVDELLMISETYRDISRNVVEELSSIMKREEPKSELIRSIDDFFQSNLHRQINMQELCRALNYSSTYIIRVVKQYHGMTPIEYFNKLKIDEAKKMLESSETIMIKDISDALGFSNQHYFSKVFKQYTGCNPSEYKRRREERHARGD